MRVIDILINGELRVFGNTETRFIGEFDVDCAVRFGSDNIPFKNWRSGRQTFRRTVGTDNGCTSADFAYCADRADITFSKSLGKLIFRAAVKKGIHKLGGKGVSMTVG